MHSPPDVVIPRMNGMLEMQRSATSRALSSSIFGVDLCWHTLIQLSQLMQMELSHTTLPSATDRA